MVKELYQVGNVCLVTARGQRRIEFAKERLEKEGVAGCFFGFYSSHKTAGKTKQEICQEQRLTHLVDDDKRHLIEVDVPDLKRIWINYNNGFLEKDLPKGMHHARTWEEVANLI